MFPCWSVLLWVRISCASWHQNQPWSLSLGLGWNAAAEFEEPALDFPKLTFYQRWAELQLQNPQSHSGHSIVRLTQQRKCGVFSGVKLLTSDLECSVVNYSLWEGSGMSCCAVSMALSHGSSRDDVSPLHCLTQLSSVPGNTFNFVILKKIWCLAGSEPQCLAPSTVVILQDAHNQLLLEERGMELTLHHQTPLLEQEKITNAASHRVSFCPGTLLQD